MKQNELHPAPGARKEEKRVGRGYGSGHGGYAGRGCKGQKSRSSVDLPRAFEGGQIPLAKRIPQKRGFHNIFRLEYSLIGLDQLKRFESGTEVNPEMLWEVGLIDSPDRPVKILANGDIDRPLKIRVHKMSATARSKIEAVGGSVEELENAAKAE